MTAKPADFDSTYFRSALGRFATGVTVITCESPLTGEPMGLTISSFASVSLNPPLVLWTLVKSASSLPHFQETERYVIHVLAASQLHLAKRFAHGSQAERFQGIARTRTADGTMKLAEPDCPAWFECFNLTRHDAGDHVVFIGQVEHCRRNFVQPLVYHAGDFDLTPSTEPLSSI
jgi:flavin reductase (DIM6/NTAB) family NADH-FMN oxidoreductase RutF